MAPTRTSGPTRVQHPARTSSLPAASRVALSLTSQRAPPPPPPTRPPPSPPKQTQRHWRSVLCCATMEPDSVSGASGTSARSSGVKHQRPVPKTSPIREEPPKSDARPTHDRTDTLYLDAAIAGAWLQHGPFESGDLDAGVGEEGSASTAIKQPDAAVPDGSIESTIASSASILSAPYTSTWHPLPPGAEVPRVTEQGQDRQSAAQQQSAVTTSGAVSALAPRTTSASQFTSGPVPRDRPQWEYI